jgi:type VI secretion system secreted protein Hcp
MAVDMFLKLDKVEGESQDGSHKGEIDVLSWSWGSRQSGTGHLGGGAGAGKVEIQDISLVKYVDRSSPVLFFLCCRGDHVPSGVLTIRKSSGGKKPLEYLKITFDKVFVTSVSTGGAKDQADQITETVTLNFSKAKVEYVPQKGDGSGGPSVTKGWDISANQEWS